MSKTKRTEALDGFRNRLGSRAAKINACLSAKTPKSLKQLEEESAQSEVYNHLKSLIKKKFVKRTETGDYIVTPTYVAELNSRDR